jgi:hypothetical protein
MSAEAIYTYVMRFKEVEPGEDPNSIVSAIRAPWGVDESVGADLDEPEKATNHIVAMMQQYAELGILGVIWGVPLYLQNSLRESDEDERRGGEPSGYEYHQVPEETRTLIMEGLTRRGFSLPILPDPHPLPAR